MTQQERVDFAKRYGLTMPTSAPSLTGTGTRAKSSEEGLKELEEWRVSRSAKPEEASQEEQSFFERNPRLANVAKTFGGPILGNIITDPKGSAETAASMVRNVGKGLTQFTVQNPGLAEVAGLVGGEEARSKFMQPRDVPLIGEVKPLSASPEDVDTNQAQTKGETLGQAAMSYLEIGAPGAGRALSRAKDAVVNKVGPFSKWAKKFSTVPEEAIEAVQRPETASKVQALRAGNLPDPVLPEIPNIPKPTAPPKVTAPDLGPMPGTADELKAIGEKTFSAAKGAEKSAMEMYGTTRQEIIKSQEGKLIQRSKEFVNGAKEALKNEGISITNGKVNPVGSQFEGSQTAKSYLQRAYEVMSRPVARQSGKTVADDLLTRREALSNIIEGIPENERSLRRAIGNMQTSFDETLDVILGPEAAQARQAYRTTMQATRPVIESMTKVENGRRVFSEDKAYNFINSALKEAKFDNTRLLSQLDDVAKTSNAKDVAKIEQARTAYEQAVEAGKATVAKINAQAKQAYEAAKTDRARQIVEAKRVRDEAAAVAKSELDALKKLNSQLSRVSPEVTENLLSVVRKQFTDLPVIGNRLTFFFSPKFWGDIALSKGLKGTAVKDVGRNLELWLLTNLIAHSPDLLSGSVGIDAVRE